jgi:hypothetical protein
MSTAVDTTKVLDRRTLHFSSLEDISADIEMLASAREIRALGNWTPGQIFQHLAGVMNHCIDGFKTRLPWPMRMVLGLFFKRRFLSKPMPPGFKLNAKAAAELIPGPLPLEPGLASIRQALQRLKTETKRVPSPFLGPLTLDEWTQLHCRHCELHLSFLVPVE